MAVNCLNDAEIKDELNNLISNIGWSIDRPIITGSVIISGTEYFGRFKINTMLSSKEVRWIAAFILRDIIKQAFGVNI